MPDLFKPLWPKGLKGGGEYCIRDETARGISTVSMVLRVYPDSPLSPREMVMVRAE
jgi:hypothetical protein